MFRCTAAIRCARTGTPASRPTRIRHGHYDFVVLQGHSLSAVDHPDELDEYAERFEHLIAETGARTVLYQTWPRKHGSREYEKNEHVHSFDEMAARVDDVYTSLAARLGARLAPVGRAFVHAVDDEPAIELYRSDDSHPTPAGSFLAACVLYGALTGEDPRGSRYVPLGRKRSRGRADQDARGERALAGCAGPGVAHAGPGRRTSHAPPNRTRWRPPPPSHRRPSPRPRWRISPEPESDSEPEALESLPLPPAPPEPAPAVATASAPPAPQ